MVKRKRNNQSPTSTIGVTSAAAAPRTPPCPRRSRRSGRKVTHYSASPVDFISTPGKLTLDETPANLDGESLPPESPYKCPAAVGIPDPRPARVLANKDKDKYDEGYDFDGVIGPFLDAVEKETTAGVEIEDVDKGLPMSMGGDGTDTLRCIFLFPGSFIFCQKSKGITEEHELLRDSLFLHRNSPH